jgi:hypothetical protein
MRPIGRWIGVSLTVLVSFQASADVFANGSDPTVHGGFPTLLRFTQSGQYMGAFPPGNPPFSEEFNSLTRGPDGGLYFLGNILGTGTVLRADPTGAGPVTIIYGSGGASSPLTIPYGIALRPGGTLFVGSWRFGNPAPGPTSVYRVDGPGTLTPWLTFPGIPQLGDIEWDPSGNNLYVGMPGDGIQRYTNGGTQHDTTIAVRSVSDFEFGPDGNLYVAAATRILKYDPTTGEELGTFVAPGSGGLMTIDDMTFGADGLLYVNSRDAGRVFQYDGHTGVFRGVFTTYNPGSTARPLFIAQVPEPDTVALAALATLTLAWRKARRSTSR